jgi:hypothetical protein
MEQYRWVHSLHHKSRAYWNSIIRCAQCWTEPNPPPAGVPFRSVSQIILDRGLRSRCTRLSTSFTSAASPSPSLCRIIRAIFCSTSTTLICLLSAGMVRYLMATACSFSRTMGGVHLRHHGEFWLA